MFPNFPRVTGKGQHAVGTLITISALALGLAFGIFILVRHRAEPVQDEEDEERLRSIEKTLDFRSREGSQKLSSRFSEVP
jgi:hypothetical protein